MYECMHVPIKTAWWAVKNPIPAGVGAAASIGIFLAYGIWPFIMVGGTVIAGMIAFVVLVSRQAKIEATAMPRVNVTTMRCVRHQDRIATSVYRLPLPGGGRKEVGVCAPCVPDFESWLDQKQLTTR
jgi:hypothetical protein